MPNDNFQLRAGELVDSLKRTGQYKALRHILGPMGPTVELEDIGEVVVLCSNDYLGLANDSRVVEAGIEGLGRHGAGTASVRFICGTFACHRELEAAIAELAGTEAALSYSSGFAANEALIPTVAHEDDVLISDELNHASIIDACRLARRTKRVVYRHNDMAELERALKEHVQRQTRWVVTDGVFSMEGDVANLGRIALLCQAYDAMLIVDDSHGVGVLGRFGWGTAEHCQVMGEVDIFTGTLGKALGGAAGGYVASSQRVRELLVQRSRPSLFSNAIAPTVACSARRAIEILRSEPRRLKKLRENVRYLREGLAGLGFEVGDSPTAILPIMIGDEAQAIARSQRLLELGVWVVGFGYPVVPKGEARLRVQVSAALEREHLDRALDGFAKL